MTDRQGFHTEELAGAYALGALEPDERLLVDVHIQGCSRCARAVDAAVQTAAFLAHAVDSAAPRPRLEARLLARVAREESAGSPGLTEAPPPSAPPRRAARGFLARRLLPVAAAVALFAGVGAWNLHLRAEVAYQQHIDALIANADSYSLTASPGARAVHGKVFIDYPTDQVLLAVNDLPALPADRAYQLWLVRPDGQRDSGGVFRANQRGHAMVLVTAPSSLDSYASLGVTAEPAGGSPGPTGPWVISCRLDDR